MTFWENNIQHSFGRVLDPKCPMRVATFVWVGPREASGGDREMACETPSRVRTRSGAHIPKGCTGLRTHEAKLHVRAHACVGSKVLGRVKLFPKLKGCGREMSSERYNVMGALHFHTCVKLCA